MKRLALALVLSASVYGQWITGFYPAGLNKPPVSAVPWSVYTHIIYFAAAPGASGTVNPQYTSEPEMSNIVAAAHANGKKIIIAISDNGGGSFLNDTTSGVIGTFVTNVVAFVNNNNFDGVDYDWEATTNVSQYNNLLTRTRAALPSPKLILSDVYNGSGLLEQVMGASYRNLDQINAMCYDMDIGSSYTWHLDALFQNGDTSKNTCDWRVNALIHAGVPAAKLGAGMPLYARHWTHTNAPRQTGGTMLGGNVDYSRLVTSGLINPTNQRWDSQYSADYLSLAATNEFYSYNGVRSVDTLVPWAKSKGLGGFMTFALDHEYISRASGTAGQFPISTRLYNDVFGTPTSPPTSGPVGYWKFDDGSGTTATDSSGNGHLMNLFRPSWLTIPYCVVTDCLSFNGTSQYGSSDLDLSGTRAVTVAFWLKWAHFSNDNRIALEFTPNFNNASTGFLILPDESVSGQFQGGFQGNAGYNQVNFPRPSARMWHHYAFIMNTSAPAATQVIPYVDGQPISYTKPTNAANTNKFGNSTLFAMSRNGTSLFGSGSLDEVYIYPRTLSAAEILALATTASSPTIRTTSSLSAGTVGLPYSQALISSASTPLTSTVSSGVLPAGLSLNSSTGVISGTPTTASSYSFIVDATNSAGNDSQQLSLTVNPASAALTYNLSDLNWKTTSIGSGTIRKNASVLGNVLALHGVTYTEGIGTHGNSQMVYNINGVCNTFQSDVGIDDEVGSAGSVNFQVFGDGVRLYDSSLMTASSATQRISISVAGRNQLGLIVNHGGTNINFDHADWANPRLTCSSAPPAAN